MVGNNFPDLRELAIVGDRRTAALITTNGAVVWYCPKRFDRSSLLAALLDPARGGTWRLRSPDVRFASRRYLEESGVLETTFTTPRGEWRVTDWMPMGEGTPQGLCRQFSAAPREIAIALYPAPDYARHPPKFREVEGGVQIDEQHYLYASHPLAIAPEGVSFTIPQGESGWAALLEEPHPLLTREDIDSWREITLKSWQKLASGNTYSGPYEREVADSLRALRLLTFEENGGIVAAATTSLPEVIGGKRNYDYRYVWLRDAGMIVSALTRACSSSAEGRRFLDFVCGYGLKLERENLLLAPFSTLSGEAAPDEEILDLAGYRNSKPVQIGNGANEQLQLDAYSNVLLAAKLIYSRFDTREHWSIVDRIADYLAEHWHEPDYGIWEERDKRQYTSGKVTIACGLDSIAEFADSEAQAQRWRGVVREIRQFVASECLTSEGAYAAVAGGEAVDVSAALFPVWAYTAPDTPQMLATMKALERDLATGHLYRRHLERFDSQKEGAFLAGTLWVAQYWVMRRDFQKVRAILDTTLEYANDLGLFAEEADPKTGKMLGNFPQTFVHAAFIGAVIDLKTALEK